MNRAIIVLSALSITSPVFATTVHATDRDVAAAHERADSAEEKLHKAQHQGEEIKLKSEQAAQHKNGTLGSKVSEDAQKVWHKTAEGTEKGWDTTRHAAEKSWDKMKSGATSLEKKVTR